MCPDSIKAVEVCAVVLRPGSCDRLLVVPEATGDIRERDRRHQLSGRSMRHFLPRAVWEGGIVDPGISTETWSLGASDVYGLEGVADAKTAGLHEISNKSASESYNREGN